MQPLDQSLAPPSPEVAKHKVVIEVRGLEKAFDGRPILHGVDLEVRAGETLVILGASGSGKSTLLRTLVGLEPPDAGCVRLWGTDIYDAPEEELSAIRRRLGMA